MSSMIGSRGMSPTGAGGMNASAPTGKTSVQKIGGYRHFQTPQFSPEQMQLFQSMFGHLGPDSFLSKLAGGDQEQFDQLEAPALKQFGELQGGISSRFSGMGSGARKSSGFQNTMNQATSDFSQQLQSQRMGLQRQAMQELMGFSNELLGQRPYNQYATPKTPSFLQSLALAGFEQGGKTARSFIGGG